MVGTVIRSFADDSTERLFAQERVAKFQAFERVALRKLILLHRSKTLRDLKGPGLGLEAFGRERRGQHAIRINDQWRLCFVWNNGDAYDVEITDYH
jgi:proteic killer suppression protein